jgi:hypothetical protein
VASDAVSVGAPLDARELRDLVKNVSKTLRVFARLVGVDLPPADNEEADAIAEPAGRMLARHPKVQKIIRKIADPIVLTGAIGAFFAARFFVRRVASAPAPAAAPRAAGATVTAAAPAPQPRPAGSDSAPPAAAPAPPLVDEVALRNQVLDSIAANGFGVH